MKTTRLFQITQSKSRVRLINLSQIYSQIYQKIQSSFLTDEMEIEIVLTLLMVCKYFLVVLIFSYIFLGK